MVHQPQVRIGGTIIITNFACINKNFPRAVVMGGWSYWLRKFTSYMQYSLKRAETRNYKIFLKKTLPKVGMALQTKYTNNKESTFHNIATFHTTIDPYI